MDDNRVQSRKNKCYHASCCIHPRKAIITHCIGLDIDELEAAGQHGGEILVEDDGVEIEERFLGECDLHMAFEDIKDFGTGQI